MNDNKVFRGLRLIWVIVGLLLREFFGARRRPINGEFMLLDIPLTGDPILEPRYFAVTNAIH